MATNSDMWDRFMNTPSIDCLDLFENEYKKSGELGDLYNHNLVLIDIGEWPKAKSNCVKMINERECSCENDFIALGMTHWFLGSTSSAVEFWKKSKDTQFSASPGAPDAPLLLWYAGQKLDDKILVKESLNKLKQYWKVADYRILNGWMGSVAIAGFLMDKVPIKVFLHEWKDREIGAIEDKRFCRANFWCGMKCLGKGDTTAATTYLKAAFSSSKMAILQYEYFLAKWEYANITNNWSGFSLLNRNE